MISIRKLISNIMLFGIVALYITVGVWIFFSVQYDRALNEFYEREWDPLKNGMSLNGIGIHGDMVIISELEAKVPASGEGTSQEWCPNITSERHQVTLSPIRPLMKTVCCWADLEQVHVPYKDKDGRRYYMCGKYPYIDIVSQPLEHVQFK